MNDKNHFFLLALYQALWKLALPLLKKNRRLQQGLSDRLWPGHLNRADIWMHAASAGEAFIASEILKRLAPRSKTAVLLTSVTAQGMDVLNKGLEYVSDNPLLACRISWFPFDMPSIVAQAVSNVRPKVTVLLETELWPALLFYLKKNRSQILIINGRLSAKSFRVYRQTKFLWNPVAPDQIMATSATDAERFAAIFQHAGIGTMPNIKFDAIPAESSLEPSPRCVQNVISPEIPLSILASVRKEEESLVLKILQTLYHTFPNQTVALFPRHMHRIRTWQRKLSKKNLPFVLKSRITRAPDPGTTILWDVFGELKHAFRFATVAFIGGSLKPLGGQNFIEPAISGVATVTGPYVENFKWTGEDIFRKGIVFKAGTWKEVAAFMADNLETPPDRQKLMNRSISHIKSRQGGAEIAADQIVKRLYS